MHESNGVIVVLRSGKPPLAFQPSPEKPGICYRVSFGNPNVAIVSAVGAAGDGYPVAFVPYGAIEFVQPTD